MATLYLFYFSRHSKRTLLPISQKYFRIQKYPCFSTRLAQSYECVHSIVCMYNHLLLTSVMQRLELLIQQHYLIQSLCPLLPLLVCPMPGFPFFSNTAVVMSHIFPRLPPTSSISFASQTLICWFFVNIFSKYSNHIQ